MKHIKTLGLALLALFAISAITAAAASAITNAEFLPAPTVSSPLKASVTGGKGKLVTVGGKEVKCEGFSGKGEFTSATLGTGSIEFTTCTSEGSKCTTGSDAKGTILAPTVDLLAVSVSEASKLLLGLLITPTANVTFTCGVLKFEVKGSIVAEAGQLRESSLTETLKTVPMPAEGTKELILAVLLTLVLNETGGKPTFGPDHLETTDNGTTFEESGIKSEETITVTFSNPEKVHIDY